MIVCGCFVALIAVPVVAFACSPPIGLPAGSPRSALNIPPRQPANSRAFGEQTHQTVADSKAIGLENANGKASAISGPVKDPRELTCIDFDDKCRWRNMEGFLVDELDWYQGAGFLDTNRLRLATGTHLAPEGFYGIAATDKVELATSKAILVSDVIECQLGQAQLSFMHWTSPEVKLIICVKSVLRLFPYFDYCSKPIETSDPGPAYVSLPDLGGEPLQIFIKAENFVFNSAALQGGFAIVDNLEYSGDFCENEYDRFAASQGSPSEHVLRPSEKVPKSAPNESLPHVWGPELYGNNNMPKVVGGVAPGGGFRSLLDWMLYGSGLARQGMAGMGDGHLLGKGESAASPPPISNQPSPEMTPTAATPPPTLIPPAAIPAFTLGMPMPDPEVAQPPTQSPSVPQQEASSIRSFRIVQHKFGQEHNEPDQEKQQNVEGVGDERGAGEEHIRGSLERQPYGKRPLPHMELLKRRGKGAPEPEAAERERVAEEEEREEQGTEGPSQVEREEWIGGEGRRNPQ